MNPNCRVKLGIDVGEVRIGVARTVDQLMAVPVETVLRDESGSDLERIAEFAEHYQAKEIIVGLPRHLSGVEGVSSKGARRYARRIARLLPQLDIRLVDERFTSVSAHALLHEAGKAAVDHREMVDQVAAVLILEQVLQIEKLSGKPAGELLRLGAEERNI